MITNKYLSAPIKERLRKNKVYRQLFPDIKEAFIRTLRYWK